MMRNCQGRADDTAALVLRFVMTIYLSKSEALLCVQRSGTVCRIGTVERASRSKPKDRLAWFYDQAFRELFS